MAAGQHPAEFASHTRAGPKLVHGLVVDSQAMDDFVLEWLARWMPSQQAWTNVPYAFMERLRRPAAVTCGQLQLDLLASQAPVFLVVADAHCKRLEHLAKTEKARKELADKGLG